MNDVSYYDEPMCVLNNLIAGLNYLLMQLCPEDVDKERGLYICRTCSDTAMLVDLVLAQEISKLEGKRQALRNFGEITSITLDNGIDLARSNRSMLTKFIAMLNSIVDGIPVAPPMAPMVDDE